MRATGKNWEENKQESRPLLAASEENMLSGDFDLKKEDRKEKRG